MIVRLPIATSDTPNSSPNKCVLCEYILKYPMQIGARIAIGNNQRRILPPLISL